ncbi:MULTISPECIES: hypothetical protein [unclassified Peribacillus]|uniref:hypothetical protein n=1 Tax=unclassified Peribacillus TaxID=2675266 RepID=UPI003671A30B
MMIKEKKKGKGFFKGIMNEICGSILSELIFNILTNSYPKNDSSFSKEFILTD